MARVVRLLAYFLVGYVIGMALANLALADTTENVVLTTANTVVFRGVVTDDTVMTAQMKLVEQVKRRGLKNYPIYLVLDSPGGSIDAGLDFIEFTKSIHNLKTISIFAASMASAIAEALPGDRLTTANGVMMFHRAQGGFQGYFENGEVESRLFIAKRMVRQMETTNSTRMQYSLEQYKSYVQSELWLFGDDNIKYRAADKVVNVICSVELIKSEETFAVSGFLGLFSASFTFSGCPLFRSPKSGSAGDDAAYVVPSAKNYKLIDIQYKVKN